MSSAQVTFQSGHPQTPPSVRYGALADPSPAELSAEGLTDDSPSNRSLSSGPSPVRDEESNAPSGTLSLPCTPPRSGVEVTPVMKPCHSAPNTPLPVQLKFEDEERIATQPPNLPEVSTPEQAGTPSTSDILLPVSPEEQRHHNMKKKKYHSAAATPGQARPRPFNPQTTYQPPKVAQVPDAGLATAGTDPRKYKTKMCRNFVMGTPCNYGTRCSFAHGVHEMRDQSHNAMPTIIGGTPIMPNAMPQVSYTYPVVIPQTLAAPQQALPVQQMGQQMVMPMQANGMAMQAVDPNAAAGAAGTQTVMVPVMMQPVEGAQNTAMVPQAFPAQQGIQYVMMADGQPQLTMGNSAQGFQ